MPRTAGDRVADIALFLFAACFAVLSADTVLHGEHPSPAVLLADQAVGALACASLFLRRRVPVQLAVALLVAGMFSHFVTGATIVAVFTVAAGRPIRTTAWVAALGFLPVPLFLARGPEPDDPATVSGITYFVLLAGAIGWGLFVRSRRQLVESLRERAESARTEARRQVREDVAREMHDVLAHRLSLLSLHAGALAFNPGASERETREAAEVIRDSAHKALEDLRGIIGVLRAGAGEASRPQPVLTDLPSLVEESRKAGMRVGLEIDADGREAPAAVGRTAYRIVQEGLTNARKHAPGSPVHVSVSGGPDEGLSVRLRNGLPAAPPGSAQPGSEAPGSEAPASGVPGAGRGLAGLAERTHIAGGRLEHGEYGGEFELRAWLPWAARHAPLESAARASAPDST